MYSLQGLYLETTPYPVTARNQDYSIFRLANSKNRRVDQSYTFLITKLGDGFKYLLFAPLFGEDSHFDEHIFQMG